MKITTPALFLMVDLGTERAVLRGDGDGGGEVAYHRPQAPACVS